MNKILTTFVLFLVLLSSSVLHATQSSVAAGSKYEEGQIIAYFDEEGNQAEPSAAYYYRKYLGKADGGYHQVQDFYSKSDKKQTDPIAVKSENELNLWEIESIEGNTTLWHENGQMLESGQYINGKEEGLWTSWYENGQKESESQYVNGKEEGLWITWYENGQKESEGRYINGEIDGSWITWHENGQKESKGQYINGKKEGLWVEWDENVNKIQETHYKNDSPIDK